VQSDIGTLPRALALAGTPPADGRPTLPSARVVDSAAATRARAAGAKDVFVSTEGEIFWEGRYVTLDEFIANLAAYKIAAGRSESQLIVKANGVHFTQLSFVFDEARKAGIKGLVIESDSEPDPKIPMSPVWF
jgi:biopolymer transport protein ExbD